MITNVISIDAEEWFETLGAETFLRFACKTKAFKAVNV